MNEMNNSPACERASDLIAFVYNEATESESREFELHLKNCAVCRQEVASFGLVRESITAWRDEVLSGFVSTPVVAITPKKSAIAAFRQFFDLSPLWLKATISFAVVTFCVLAALTINSAPTAINRTEGGSPGSIAAKYTQEDVDRLVKEAIAKHENPTPPIEKADSIAIAQRPTPKPKLTTRNPAANSRRPLTRAEREQLAADLRLLSADDDANLNLLGDRINQ